MWTIYISWYSHADFSTVEPAQPGRYYPHTEDSTKIIAFVLSCFVGKCETRGPEQKHHQTVVVWVTIISTETELCLILKRINYKIKSTLCRQYCLSLILSLSSPLRYKKNYKGNYWQIGQGKCRHNTLADYSRGIVFSMYVRALCF